MGSQIEMLSAISGLSDEAIYAACRTNGTGRATDWDMAHRYEALRRIVADIRPCGVRQTFYQATVRGVVDKTEAGYEKVQRGLVTLREADVIPYRWITDNTRWQIKPGTHDSLQAALDEFERSYRRAVWSDVGRHVEVWLEKDALAGVVHPITSEYDVPLMVTRGFSSISFLHSAAKEIEALDLPTYIYHLGDWDPSGQLAGDHIEDRLREYAPNAGIYFERLAVGPEQIEEWELPTRPTKKSTHSKGWKGDSVELDAIHPGDLRDLVRNAIEQHIPSGHLEHLAMVEAEERKMIEYFRGQAER